MTLPREPKKKSLFFLFLLMTLVLPLTSVNGQESKKPVPPAVDMLKKETEQVLARIDTTVAVASKKIAEAGIDSAEARAIVQKVCSDVPSVVNCAVVDMRGTVIVAEPEPFRKLEGTNRIGHEHVRKILKTGIPTLSSAFKGDDGTYGVSVAHSVRTDRGPGALIVSFRPEILIGDIVRSMAFFIPVQIFFFETNGKILYTENTADVGVNILTNPRLQTNRQLSAVVWKASKIKTGSDTFVPLDKDDGGPPRKTAHWTTVALHGKEWRIVFIRPLLTEETYGFQKKTQPDLSRSDAALRAFCGKPGTVQALATGDRAQVTNALRSFYEANADMFSVQWINANGVNVLGYPAENSLKDYDFKKLRDASDEEVLKIVLDKKEGSLTRRMIVGGTARLFICPVFRDGEYLGSICSVFLID